MSQQYDDTNRGVLFKNDRKETDSHPDYKGSINVGGVDYWLSAWIKDGAKGKFMSLSVKAKEAPAAPKHTPKPTPKKPPAGFDDLDEVPF